MRGKERGKVEKPKRKPFDVRAVNPRYKGMRLSDPEIKSAL